MALMIKERIMAPIMFSEISSLSDDAIDLRTEKFIPAEPNIEKII